MSIIDTIIAKLFGDRSSGAGTVPPAAQARRRAGAPDYGTTAPPALGSVAPAPMSKAEVEALLASKAATYDHAVDWRTSIVDLMGILGMDNSLAQRRALAQELNYPGNTNDTAAMDTWLHTRVMQKLEGSGGRPPADPAV